MNTLFVFYFVTPPIRFHRDLVINLVASPVDTVCVGSLILILVTSAYRRIVRKMFFLSLCAKIQIM